MKRNVRRMLISIFLVVAVTCSAQLQDGSIDERETLERPMSEVLPEPGEQVPITPQTLATTRVWKAAVEENQKADAPNRMIVGEIEEMGPFTAEDAADGKWIRIQSFSEIPYVLVPGKLWARSSNLHINKGVTIRVRGQVGHERGRTVLVADTIEVQN